MNKSELIDKVAASADIPKAVAGRALDAVIESITGALAEGDSVVLVGFGTFAVKDRAARTGRNPQTGNPIEIAAAKIHQSELLKIRSQVAARLVQDHDFKAPDFITIMEAQHLAYQDGIHWGLLGPEEQDVYKAQAEKQVKLSFICIFGKYIYF